MKKILSYALLSFILMFVGVKYSKAMIYYRPSDSDIKHKCYYKLGIKQTSNSSISIMDVYKFVKNTNNNITDGKVYEVDAGSSKTVLKGVYIVTFNKNNKVKSKKKIASNKSLYELSNIIFTYDGNSKSIYSYKSPKERTFSYLPTESQYKNKYHYQVKYTDMVCSTQTPSSLVVAPGITSLDPKCSDKTYTYDLEKTNKTAGGVPIYQKKVQVYSDEVKNIEYIVKDKSGKVIKSIKDENVKLSSYDNKVVDFEGKKTDLSEYEGTISQVEQHNNVELKFVACGGKDVTIDDICNDNAGAAAYDIPVMVPALTSFLVNALKIATPIILIFIGMIQIVKALTSTSDDEIKKAQSSLIKKIIIAVFIFFTIAITQFVIDKVSDSYNSSEQSSTGSCIDCFVNNHCQLTYYRLGEHCTAKSTKKE